jgi:hypothetical protein
MVHDQARHAEIPQDRRKQMTKELYAWRDYPCRSCKDIFKGDALMLVPSGWNYDVRLCLACYKSLNSYEMMGASK